MSKATKKLNSALDRLTAQGLIKGYDLKEDSTLALALSDKVTVNIPRSNDTEVQNAFLKHFPATSKK